MSLEKILKKSVGIAGIVCALSNYNAEAQEAVLIKVAPESKHWIIGATNRVNIIVDNTRLDNKGTFAVNSKLIEKSPVVVKSELPKKELDFFNGYVMSIENNENKRTTESDFDTIKRIATSFGPTNKIGELWNYEIKAEGNPGQRNFALYGVEAHQAGKNAERIRQKIIVQNYNVAYVPEQVEQPVVAVNIDVFSKKPEVYVAGKAGQSYFLQASEDLQNWTAVYTNKSPGSFSYIDNDTSGSSRRFYRAVELGN